MTDLPEPLTPAACDLRDFPFMPLDVARLRDSGLAASETPENCWAAVLLWCASWHQAPAASIPDDDQWIARSAGYTSRGRIDPAWKKVRAGALHGWVKCSDGRLYHPIVAEKACEAWKSKLEQRWRTECARIKKHNQRHEISLPFPEFSEWVSHGCPQGQTLPVPRDKPDLSHGQDRETASKGQGQGQGQGQGDSIVVGAEAPPGDPQEPPSAASAAPTTRGSRLPSGWLLPKAWGEWALAELPGWTAEMVRLEADKFADYWHGKTGKDATKADWLATWRNWCRNARNPAAEPPRGRDDKPSAAASVEQTAEYLRAQEEHRNSAQSESAAAARAATAAKARERKAGATP